MYNLNNNQISVSENKLNIFTGTKEREVGILTSLLPTNVKMSIISGSLVACAIVSMGTMTMGLNCGNVNLEKKVIPIIGDNNNENIYKDVMNVSQLSYNNPILNLNAKSKDVSNMVVEKEYNDVEIIQVNKPLLLAEDMREYDYYIDIPKENVFTIECDSIVYVENKFELNWEV